MFQPQLQTMMLLQLLCLLCLSSTKRPHFPAVSSFVVMTPPAFTHRHSSFVIYGKKKKSSTPSASSKIQVKLTKHIKGTGQAGDIVSVTPAFFNNRLRPTASAQMITAEQVEHERVQKLQAQQEQQQKAQELQHTLQQLPTIAIARKAGPNGQLFGGVKPKQLMDEVCTRVKEEQEFLKGKQVKITTVTDDEGQKVTGDLKHVGDYTVTLQLTSDYSAQLAVSIQADTGS